MLGRLKRFIVNAIAEKQKTSFLRQYSSDWLKQVENAINVKVVSFSGKMQFGDQLFSISSFYKNVGQPLSWVIYNDGTYTKNEIEVFEQIPGVSVCELNINNNILPTQIFKSFPTLMKVEILRIIHPEAHPVIFSDSDIIFYSKFNEFLGLIKTENWYLVDEGSGYFEPGFALPEGEQPLNLGFLILNKKSDWEFVINYLLDKIYCNTIHYWSDQTAVHQLAQKEHFLPLPKKQFIVGGNDAFSLSHCVDYNEIALRHFVGPVRHKMWQYPWKKVLGIR